MRLFQVGESGDVEKFIGGCAEKITMNSEYDQRKIEYPGVATPKRKKVGEAHTVEIENLWLLDTNAHELPDIDPDLLYRLEINWTEDATFSHASRIYEGVTLRGDRVTLPAQNLTFDAETRVTEAVAP